jgi:hypothetical protein
MLNLTDALTGDSPKWLVHFLDGNVFEHVNGEWIREWNIKINVPDEKSRWVRVAVDSKYAKDWVEVAVEGLYEHLPRVKSLVDRLNADWVSYPDSVPCIRLIDEEGGGFTIEYYELTAGSSDAVNDACMSEVN